VPIKEILLLVARLIQQYGVDIRQLDDMLVGAAPSAETAQNSNIQSAVNQAIAPYQQMMQQYQQGQQQQAQQAEGAIRTEVSTFSTDPTNEFYKDVAADMADLLELNAARGNTVTMKEAYDRACRMNPEISKIIDMRSAQGLSASKRAASSSISGQQGGEGGGVPDTMRGAIEDAWANAGRG
jgi:hypothetical protein